MKGKKKTEELSQTGGDEGENTKGNEGFWTEHSNRKIIVGKTDEIQGTSVV